MPEPLQVPNRSTITTAVLKVDALQKSFGGNVVVDDVSFVLGEGESLTLLGPSGCGKTTTLRMIAGLERPDGGDIYLRGARVTDVQPHRRDIGFVFQDFALFPHLNVFDNLAFGLKLRGVAKTEIARRVTDALDLVRLPEKSFGARMPSQLSGGQRQRVAIARTLVTDPKLILFDEPLAALDRQLRDHMLLELKDLQRRTGIPAIYVTHDQEAAMILADQVVVMNGGKVEQVGAPTDIFRHPASYFVATFLGEMNLIPMTVAAQHAQGTLLKGEALELYVEQAEFAAGSAVVAGIRPLDLKIAAEPGENTIAATVVGSHFAGSSSVIQLKTDAGVELTVRTTELLALPSAGERLWAQVGPSAISVLDAKCCELSSV